MMYCKCDGCNKEEPATHNGRNWFKPKEWYERTDGDEVLQACSRECIDRIHHQRLAEGKESHNIVLPI